MGARITIEVLAILLLTTLIAVIGYALVFGVGEGDIPYRLEEATRFLLGPSGIAVGLWALLLVIFSIVLRRRRAGVRIVVHLVTLVVANLVNLGVLAALAATALDSWFGLVVVIAAAAGLVLLVAACVAVPVTELLILRALPAPARSAAPVESPAAEPSR